MLKQKTIKMEKITIFSRKKIKANLPCFVEQEKILQNKKILLVSPHSDDISISFGGFVYELAKENDVLPVLFFAGFRGVLKKSKAEATAIRQKEMKKEAKTLKTLTPVALNLASYENSKKAIEKDVIKVKALFLKEKPEIVFLPKKDDSHPSHKLAAKICLLALKKIPGRLTLFFYENPWSLFSSEEINAIFVLDKEALQAKKQAVLSHKSQIARTDFLTASLSLGKFRAATLPEQKIFGFGNKPESLGFNFLEIFKKWKY